MDMRGSGIYTEDVTGLKFTCKSCNHENESADGYIDDWKDLFGICDECSEHTEIEEEADDFYDSDNDYYED